MLLKAKGERRDGIRNTRAPTLERLAGGPVLHVHMPKTAGTSLCFWAERRGLRVARHEGSLCWERGDGPYWMGEAGLPASCRQRLSEAQGNNFSWNSVERWVDLPLCEGMRYVVALRRPLERTLHQFQHLLRHFRDVFGTRDIMEDVKVGVHFFSKLWRYGELRGELLAVFGRGTRQDPDDWLDHWLGMSTNYQVRTLAGAGGAELSGKGGPPRHALQLLNLSRGRIAGAYPQENWWATSWKSLLSAEAEMHTRRTLTWQSNALGQLLRCWNRWMLCWSWATTRGASCSCVRSTSCIGFWTCRSSRAALSPGGNTMWMASCPRPTPGNGSPANADRPGCGTLQTRAWFHTAGCWRSSMGSTSTGLASARAGRPRLREPSEVQHRWRHPRRGGRGCTREEQSPMAWRRLGHNARALHRRGGLWVRSAWACPLRVASSLAPPYKSKPETRP